MCHMKNLRRSKASEYKALSLSFPSNGSYAKPKKQPRAANFFSYRQTRVSASQIKREPYEKVTIIRYLPQSFIGNGTPVMRAARNGLRLISWIVWTRILNW